MTKTELQLSLAEATQTSKKTAGVFLETLSTLAYKEVKKNGEFVLPGFGKLVKQKRNARTGLQPQDVAEDQDSSQDRRKILTRQGGEGRGSRSKEVVSAWARDSSLAFGNSPTRFTQSSRVVLESFSRTFVPA